MILWNIPLLLSLASIIVLALASPLHSRTNCRKTKIAVLGAGTAGIFAAVSLLGGIFNESLTHSTLSKLSQMLPSLIFWLSNTTTRLEGEWSIQSLEKTLMGNLTPSNWGLIGYVLCRIKEQPLLKKIHHRYKAPSLKEARKIQYGLL